MLNPYTIHLKLIQHCAYYASIKKKKPPAKSWAVSRWRRRRGSPPFPRPRRAGLEVKIGELPRACSLRQAGVPRGLGCSFQSAAADEGEGAQQTREEARPVRSAERRPGCGRNPVWCRRESCRRYCCRCCRCYCSRYPACPQKPVSDTAPPPPRRGGRGSPATPALAGWSASPRAGGTERGGTPASQ